MQAGRILSYRLCSRAGQVGAGSVTTDLVKDRSARLLAGFRDAAPLTWPR